MGSNLVKAQLGTSRTAKSFFTGPSGHCAILDNDEVKCFGGRGNETFSFSDAESFVGDFANELGDNNPSLPELGSERIIKIVHGDRDICFLFDDFSAACAGEDNEYFNNGRNEITASSFARIYQEKLEVGSHRYVLDIDVNGVENRLDVTKEISTLNITEHSVIHIRDWESLVITKKNPDLKKVD